MPCNKNYSDLISQYVDNELDKEESQNVLEHISECDECKKEYEELIKIKKGLSSFVKESEKSVADEVMKKISADKPKKTPFIFRHIGLAASLVIILILALYSNTYKTPPVENSSVPEEKIKTESAVSIKNSLDTAPLESESDKSSVKPALMPSLTYSDKEKLVEEIEKIALEKLPNATVTIKGGTEVDDGVYSVEAENGENFYVIELEGDILSYDADTEFSEVTVEADLKDVINNIEEHYDSYALINNVIKIKADLFSLLQNLDFTPTKVVAKGQGYVKIIVE